MIAFVELTGAELAERLRPKLDLLEKRLAYTDRMIDDAKWKEWGFWDRFFGCPKTHLNGLEMDRHGYMTKIISRQRALREAIRYPNKIFHVDIERI